MSTQIEIKVIYDEFSDVAYMNVIGASGPVEGREEMAGLVLRREAVTEKAFGATILDYKHYWLADDLKANILVSQLSAFFKLPEDDIGDILEAVEIHGSCHFSFDFSF